jgi:DNA invertase Pin-like site-specific DNA recombinase
MVIAVASLTRPNSFKISFFDEDKAIKNFNPSSNKVVAYARLSVDEDGANYCSILNQLEIIKNHVDRIYKDNSCDYKEISDDDITGYSFERPGLFQLLEKIENGKCNTIIAKDLSRIGRHNALTNLFIEQCQRVGVRVLAIDEYDSKKESDDVILGIRTWSNERVVKDTSSKVRRVVDHKQSNGTWFCAAPYGYKVIDYKEGIVEIDPIAAKTVQRIFEMYAKGIGMKKITIVLSEEGVPTPTSHAKSIAISEGKTYKRPVSNRWVVSQVQKMLTDDFYIGNLRTNKYTRRGINGKDIRLPKSDHYVFENHHEPIISQDLFDRVQKQRNKRSSENFRGHKSQENIFHGILRCGECGEVLFAYRRKDIEPQYVCSTYFRYNKDACTRHMIKEKTLIQITIDYLSSVREACSKIIAQLDKEVSKLRRSKEHDDETIGKLAKQIANYQNELLTIEEQRIKQILNRPEREDSINAIYDAMYEKADANLRVAIERHSQLKNISVETGDLQKKARTSLGIIDHIIATGEITRRDVELIFDTITVYEDGGVEVCLKRDIGIAGAEPYSIIDRARKQRDKRYTIVNSSANVVREGEGLETKFTESASFIECLHDMSIKMRKK